MTVTFGLGSRGKQKSLSISPGAYFRSRLEDDDQQQPGPTLEEYTRLSFGSRWIDAPYHPLMYDALTRVNNGTLRRLAVFMPPRHGKTQLCSMMFPAWFLGNNPDKRVIVSTHTDLLALRISRRVRNQITARTWPWPSVRLTYGESAVGEWGISGRQGGMSAVGVGAAISGRGGDVILIDDPHRNRQSADSLLVQERTWEWYQDDIYTRLEPGGAIILVLTRWNTGDLAGRILNHKPEDGVPWEVISFPAIATGTEPDALGRREGEALWPARWPIEALREIKADISLRGWASEYQQTPTDDESAIFKTENMETRYKVLEDFESITRIIQTVDSAWKTGPAHDWSVIATWAKVTWEGKSWYALLDIWRDRVVVSKLCTQIVVQNRKWHEWSAAPVTVYVEDKASGIAAVQVLTAESHIPIKPWPGPDAKLAGVVSLSKQARAELIAEPIFAANRILLPERAKFIAAWYDEHKGFPAVPHDDLVDTTVMALSMLSSPVSRVRWL